MLAGALLLTTSCSMIGGQPQEKPDDSKSRASAAGQPPAQNPPPTPTPTVPPFSGKAPKLFKQTPAWTVEQAGDFVGIAGNTFAIQNRQVLVIRDGATGREVARFDDAGEAGVYGDKYVVARQTSGASPQPGQPAGAPGMQITIYNSTGKAERTVPLPRAVRLSSHVSVTYSTKGGRTTGVTPVFDGAPGTPVTCTLPVQYSSTPEVPIPTQSAGAKVIVAGPMVIDTSAKKIRCISTENDKFTYLDGVATDDGTVVGTAVVGNGGQEKQVFEISKGGKLDFEVDKQVKVPVGFVGNIGLFKEKGNTGVYGIPLA